MAFPTSRSVRGAVAAAMVMALGGAFTSAGALPVCATPTASTPMFARGTSNTVSWTVGEPHGGFEIEVAGSPDTDATGAFVEPLQALTTGRFATQREFDGLEERQYFYHVRSIDKAGVCTASPWSALVTTIQDQTAPAATFTTEPLTPLPFAPFVLEDPIVLEGAATDAPGEHVSLASGAAEVVVNLEAGVPDGGVDTVTQIGDVNGDGTWSVAFSGIQPGMYVAYATAIDAVRNAADSPARLEILVVGP
jgi:hypothetical protein